MVGRDPTRIAETLRGVAAGTTMFRISPGQVRTISAGILLAAADVADELATVTGERDRAMRACEQIGAQIAEKDDEIAKLRAENERWQRVAGRHLDCAMADIDEIDRLREMIQKLDRRIHRQRERLAWFERWADQGYGLDHRLRRLWQELASKRGREADRLRAGITAAVEGRYERQVSGLDDRYCQHDVLRRRDCPQCLDAHLSALLDTRPAPGAGEGKR